MLSFRDGSAADLESTFALSARTMHALGGDSAPELTDDEIRSAWLRRRSFVEYLAAQPEGRYVIAEDAGAPVGYARVVRFDGMDELTELMVCPARQGQGVGRQLLEIAWPGQPSAELGRIVVATGEPTDLTLYLSCGVMPVAGHWELRAPTERYLAQRSQEIDIPTPAVHVLKPDRAVAEWKRIEPEAVSHDRPALHDFFGRDRTCLARIDEAGGDAAALCWVSSEGEIGPAVASRPGDLIPVVVAALDSVARTQQPRELQVFSTTLAWHLLRRLEALGFSVRRAGWILCSTPLPGLDRYLPMRPPQLL